MACFQAFITVAGKAANGDIGADHATRYLDAQCLLGADSATRYLEAQCLLGADHATRYLRRAPTDALSYRSLSQVHQVEHRQ
jgi:hypothetical protein